MYVLTPCPTRGVEGRNRNSLFVEIVSDVPGTRPKGVLRGGGVGGESVDRVHYLADKGTRPGYRGKGHDRGRTCPSPDSETRV